MLVVSTNAISTTRGVSIVRKKGPDGNPIPVTVTAKYLGEGMSEILTGDVKAGDTLVVTSAAGVSIFGVTIPGVTSLPAGVPGAGRQGGTTPTVTR